MKWRELGAEESVQNQNGRVLKTRNTKEKCRDCIVEDMRDKRPCEDHDLDRRE